MSFLSVQNVEKCFANHVALCDVSLSVKKGEIFGLLGPNGAGKTTLIRIINQITAPDQGQVFLDGKLLSPKDIERIGYLPEERGLYKKMKVGEQALYLARLKGMSRNDALKRLKYWFEKFEIQAWWDKKVEELSKGMQQKIQFVTTVLHKPDLLIFDEPFSGFDPINANLLKNEILELKKNGATVIFSTHNMSSVEEICDSIALINNAKVILEGEVAEVRQKYKSNIMQLTFSGDGEKFQALVKSRFDLLELRSLNSHYEAQIKFSDTENPNSLLRLLLDDFQILGLQELLPGMNEVFIKVVEASNN